MQNFKVAPEPIFGSIMLKICKFVSNTSAAGSGEPHVWPLLILFSASKNSRITQLIINNTCVSIKHLFNECVSPSSIVIVD